MEQLVKKVIYTGVGVIAQTTEKVQKSINEMIDKGQLPMEEGKKIVEDFTSNSEKKMEEFETKTTRIFKKMTDKLDVPSKREYDELLNRLAALENKLAKLEKGTKKTTAKTKTA